MLAIIGGSGIYGLGKKYVEEDIITPYGDSEIFRYKIGRKEIIFLPRHGKTHSLPPHKINYKANIYALNKLGVTACLGIYACGVISKYRPGDFILLDDFFGFDFPITFFDDFSSGMRHVDFSQPFNKKLISRLKEAAAIHGVKLKNKGIVKTTPGPRFETRAEINAIKKMGANLVSMTASYEITLMKEMEIPFVGLAVGTNYACGVSKKPLDHEEVLEIMSEKKKLIGLIAKEFIKFIR